MRQNRDIEAAIEAFGDAVWRACVLHFKNTPDAQDAFQETFLAYALYEHDFKNDTHKKAWLLRVAMNTCKDMLKRASRQDLQLSAQEEKSSVSETVSSDPYIQPENTLGEAVEAINALGDPPRSVVYLNLYEGYSAVEISKILNVPLNTVYTWISRGKKNLKEALR